MPIWRKERKSKSTIKNILNREVMKVSAEEVDNGKRVFFSRKARSVVVLRSWEPKVVGEEGVAI